MFNKYIKQNIVMVVLRKANIHSVYICRLMKNQSCKKIQGEKRIQNLNLNCGFAH